MKVTGGATLHAPVQDVWAALNDPAVLVRAIPGCERLQATGPDAYQMTVTAGVGTITGTYTGEISLSDQQRPNSFLMTASGAGAPGTVSTNVRVRLADDGDGATRLTYDADAVVGGMIAGVGQRMLASVAKRKAGEFFTAIDELLVSRVAAAAPGWVAGPAGGGAGLAGGAPGPAAGPAGGAPGAAMAPAAGAAAEAAAVPAGAAGQVWEAPARPRPAGVLRGRRGPGAAGPPGLLAGVVVGAAVALAGVVVGGLIARRNR